MAAITPAQQCPPGSGLVEDVDIPGVHPLPSPVLVDVASRAVHGDGVPLQSVSITAPPSVGQATVVGDLIRYAPATAPSGGVVEIGFRVTWSDGTSADGEVCIGNDCPWRDVQAALIARPDLFGVTLDGSAQRLDVLGNDSGSGLQITSVSPSVLSIGTVTVATDAIGDFVELTQMSPGTDSFVYTLSDGISTSSASVSVTVSGAAVDAIDDQISVGIADAVVDAFVLRNDIGDGLSIVAISTTSTSVASIALSTSGEHSLEVTPTAVGTAAVDYTVSDGTTTDTATLTITVEPPAPVRAFDDGPVTYAVGDGAQTLLVLENDQPSNGVWISGHGSSPFASIVSRGDRLEVTPTSPGSGTFEYTITDGYSSDSATVSLTVEPPALSIAQQPQDAQYVYRERATFTASAQGGVQPYDFEWLRNGGPLVFQQSNHQITSNGDTSTLTIDPALAEATYQLVVTDALGQVAESRVASLSRLFAEITRPLGSLVIEVGQSAYLQVDVSTNGSTPSYAWFLDGQRITASDSRFQGFDSNRLQIVSADASVAGEIRVTIDNEIHLESTGRIDIVDGRLHLADSFQTGFGGRNPGEPLDGHPVQVGGATWGSSGDWLFTNEGSVRLTSSAASAWIDFIDRQPLDPGGYLEIAAGIDHLDEPGETFGVMFRDGASTARVFVEYIASVPHISGRIYADFEVRLSDGREDPALIETWQYRVVESGQGARPVGPYDLALRLAPDWTVEVAFDGTVLGQRSVDPFLDEQGLAFQAFSPSGMATPLEVVSFSAGPVETIGPETAQIFDSFSTLPPGTDLDRQAPDRVQEGKNSLWSSNLVVAEGGLVENTLGSSGWANLHLGTARGERRTVMEAGIDYQGTTSGWASIGFLPPGQPLDGEFKEMLFIVHTTGFYELQLVKRDNTWHRLLSGVAPTFVSGGGPNVLGYDFDRLTETVTLTINGADVVKNVSVGIDGERPSLGRLRLRAVPKLADDPDGQIAVLWVAARNETDPAPTSEEEVWETFLAPDDTTLDPNGVSLEGGAVETAAWATTTLDWSEGFVRTAGTTTGYGTFDLGASVRERAQTVVIEADLRLLSGGGWTAFGGWTSPNITSYNHGELFVRAFHHGRIDLLSGPTLKKMTIGQFEDFLPDYQLGDWFHLALVHHVPSNTVDVVLDDVVILEGFDLSTWDLVPDYRLVGLHMRASQTGPPEQQHLDNLRVRFVEDSVSASETFTAFGFGGRTIDGPMRDASVESRDTPLTWKMGNGGVRFGEGRSYTSSGWASLPTAPRAERREIYSVTAHGGGGSWTALALRGAAGPQWDAKVRLSTAHYSNTWARLRIDGVVMAEQIVPVQESYDYRLVVDGPAGTLAAYVDDLEILAPTAFAALGLDPYDGSCDHSVIHVYQSPDDTAGFDNYLWQSIAPSAEGSP